MVKRRLSGFFCIIEKIMNMFTAVDTVERGRLNFKKEKGRQNESSLRNRGDGTQSPDKNPGRDGRRDIPMESQAGCRCHLKWLSSES